MRLLHALLTAPLLVACTLVTSLDGLSGGDAIDGGAADAPTATDGPSDGGVLPVVPGGPVTIASNVGAQYFAMAQQAHVLYAKNARRWVLFYLDNAFPQKLRTRVSTDFAVWSDGPDLDLPYPHQGDGRNLAAAYLDAKGTDVLHLSISLQAGAMDRRHYHGRALLAAGGLVFDALAEIGKTTNTPAFISPDGPAVTLLPSGQVIDGSGWYSPPGSMNTSNAFAWASSSVDTGGSWTPAFGTAVQVEVVTQGVNARAMLVVGDLVGMFWESGDLEPRPTGVTAAGFTNSAWSSPSSVGFTKQAFDVNDWAVAPFNDTTAHAVRFAGAFEHRIYDGTAWGAGQPIAPQATAPGTGIVLVPSGSGLLLAAIDATTGALRGTSWEPAGGWSAWRDLTGSATHPRSQLSGYGGSAGAALVWLESDGIRRDIAGTLLR